MLHITTILQAQTKKFWYGVKMPRFTPPAGGYGKPTVIIAHTIPGKGVAEIEGDYKWHGTPPNKEQADRALRELRTLGGKIKSEHE